MPTIKRLKRMVKICELRADWQSFRELRLYTSRAGWFEADYQIIRLMARKAGLL